METTFRLILGQRGTGKSLFLRHRILETERCLFFDPLREWTGRSFETLPELNRATNEREFFRFAFWPDDPEEDFPEFLRIAREKGSLMVAVDESDLVAPVSHLPAEVRSFILRSRHEDISLAFASQRPACLSSIVRSQASRVTSFRMVDPLDLGAVRHIFGHDTDRLSSLKIGQSLERIF